MINQKYKIIIQNKQLKWIYILVAGVILFYVLLILSKMIYHFPSSDFTSSITKIWFMSNTGMGKTIYWYSDYYPFLQYPPFASFIGAIIYSFINNLAAVLYIEILLMILFCFFGFLFLKQIKQLTWLDTVIYFLIFLINPVTTGWFFKYGRTTEFLGWVCLIFIFGFVYKYKDKELDKGIFLLIIPLTLSILSHPTAFLLSFFPLGGLIISKIKKPKQIAILIFILFFVMVLSSFWVFPMVMARISGKYVSLILTPWGDIGPLEKIVYPIFFSILALIILILKRGSRYMIWPILLVSIIYSTGLERITPIYNSIPPRPYAILLILFLIFESKKEWLKINLLILAIILFSLTSLFFFNSSIIKFSSSDSFFNSSINLLGKNSADSFLIIKDDSYSSEVVNDIYSYVPIYLNYTTPYGWFSQEETPNLYNLKKDLNSDNCSLIKSALIELKVKKVISDKCDFLSNECKLSLIDKENKVCLYKVN